MILVTGGNGFVGREVVKQLVAQGHLVRVLSRRKSSKRFGGQIAGAEIMVGDILDSAFLDRAMVGVKTVIHLVGIIAETSGATFGAIHKGGTRKMVSAAERNGVTRFLHMSALGARPDAPARYHRTKFAAEEIVRQSRLAWTIFRPSIVFGKGDAFVNLFAGMMKTPLRQMPMIGDGTNLMAPIAVEDVAFAFVRALTHSDTVGQSYDLGGASISYRDMLLEIGHALELNPVVLPSLPALITALPFALIKGANPAIVPVPFAVASSMAWLMDLLLPSFITPPLTNDQILMLQEDQKGDLEKAYQEFKFTPVPFKEGIKKYLNP